MIFKGNIFFVFQTVLPPFEFEVIVLLLFLLFFDFFLRGVRFQGRQNVEFVFAGDDRLVFFDEFGYFHIFVFFEEPLVVS